MSHHIDTSKWGAFLASLWLAACAQESSTNNRRSSATVETAENDASQDEAALVMGNFSGPAEISKDKLRQTAGIFPTPPPAKDQVVNRGFLSTELPGKFLEHYGIAAQTIPAINDQGDPILTELLAEVNCCTIDLEKLPRKYAAQASTLRQHCTALTNKLPNQPYGGVREQWRRVKAGSVQALSGQMAQHAGNIAGSAAVLGEYNSQKSEQEWYCLERRDYWK